MLKKIWYDPVWSKVIAGVILASFGTVLAGLKWPSVRDFLLAASPVPHWLLGLLALIAICATGFVLVAMSATARIVPVGDAEAVEDKTPGRTYPLKVVRVMRNDSGQAADVRISDYRPGAVSLKKFVTDVLQVKLREWCPDKEGIDRVPVLPGQQFKVWVGVDENKFTKHQLDRLRGQIGTLVFVVNGQRVEIPL